MFCIAGSKFPYLHNHLQLKCFSTSIYAVDTNNNIIINREAILPTYVVLGN